MLAISPLLQFFILLLIIFFSPLLGFFFLRKNLPKKFLSFFLGLAAGTFVFLFLFEFLEEVNNLTGKDFFVLIILLAAGFAFNAFLDFLLPGHQHHHHDHCQHQEKFCHLTAMTVISLAAHNLIEGFTFGLVARINLHSALMMALMIALHNIPLNLALLAPETYAQRSKKHILKHFFWANLPFVLGAGSFFFSTDLISESVLELLAFFIFGMIIHLLKMEILPLAWEKQGKKTTIWGIFGGLLLVIFIHLF